MPIEETLEALHDVGKAGKARYIGASSMFAWQLAAMLHVAEASQSTAPASAAGGARQPPQSVGADALFATRAEPLTEPLDQNTVHGEAAEVLSRLIESVTIYPSEDGSTEAEIVACLEMG